MNSQTKQMRIRPEAGFTLIELLVVIVIIGVLFAVALPVFENAGRKDTDRAAYQVMTTLRLARQNAIAKRQWTLVVFPNRDGGAYTGTDGNDLKKCLRSYAVLAATNNLDGIYKFNPALRDPRVSDMNLVFVSDWKYLPEGLYFDDDKTVRNNYIFGAQSSAQDTYTGVFRYPIDPARTNVLRPMGAILFKPNGRSFTCYDSKTNGYFWQDAEAPWLKQISSLYITAAQYYEETGGTLTGPTPIPGTNTVIHIRNKTGQVNIFDGIWE